MKICAHKLISAIYCIAWSFFSLRQAKTCNFQKYRVTEGAVCMWVTSKITYWYIRDVCSVASHVKGYQALLPLTFCRRVGGESENKARLAWCHSTVIHIYTECTALPSNEHESYSSYIHNLISALFQQCCWHHTHIPIFLVTSITKWTPPSLMTPSQHMVTVVLGCRNALVVTTLIL